MKEWFGEFVEIGTKGRDLAVLRNFQDIELSVLMNRRDLEVWVDLLSTNSTTLTLLFTSKIQSIKWIRPLELPQRWHPSIKPRS
jgi:hypothetical protein